MVGEKKNRPHYTHRDYWEIMNIIIDETKDDSFTELFALAENSMQTPTMVLSQNINSHSTPKRLEH